jgi:hypothetical protein
MFLPALRGRISNVVRIVYPARDSHRRAHLTAALVLKVISQVVRGALPARRLTLFLFVNPAGGRETLALRNGRTLSGKVARERHISQGDENHQPPEQRGLASAASQTDPARAGLPEFRFEFPAGRAGRADGVAGLRRNLRPQQHAPGYEQTTENQGPETGDEIGSARDDRVGD